MTSPVLLWLASSCAIQATSGTRRGHILGMCLRRACIVFLEHYLGDLMAKTGEDKLAGILAKTWNKRSATACTCK
jgi:hypothetical protein